MKSSFYPKADRTTQWWEKDYTRGVFTKIEKILFHTTETTGWPSYSKGSIAPTLTYKPATREWRQHNFLDTSARALGDPASTPVRENRDNVIQIEIIWYAGQIGNLPDTAYRDLAEFVAYVRKEWGGPSLNFANVGGPNDDVHLTNAQYDAFNGLLGHANAPKPSTHWDPGKLDYSKIVKYVRELEKGPVVPTPTPPTTPSVNPNTVQARDIPNPSVKQILEWDGIQAPNAAADDPNKFWTLANYTRWGYKQGTQIIEQNKQILENQKKMLDLLAKIAGV